MTRRDKTIKKLNTMAAQIVKDFDADTNRKMWRLCCDWNSNHPDEEIMMCESEDDDGNYVFCIEDDMYRLVED